MYTLEQLAEESSKKHISGYWYRYIKMYGKEPESCRHPDTITSGVLSTETVNKVFRGLRQ